MPGYGLASGGLVSRLIDQAHHVDELGQGVGNGAAAFLLPAQNGLAPFINQLAHNGGLARAGRC